VCQQKKRIAPKHRDRHEIARGIVRKRFEGVGIGDERRRGREEKRVAVGSGAGGSLRPDDISPAWAVLHHNLLAEAARYLIRNQSTDDIGGAACSLGDNKFDRPRGPALSLRLTDDRCEDKAGGNEAKAVSSTPQAHDAV